MPTDTADQQITLPIGVDTADNPVAFINFVADVEQRLVRRYTNAADRTARMLVLTENDLSTLAAEDRVEVYDGIDHVSLYSRCLFSQTRVNPSQILTQNTTVLQNVTNLFAPMPLTGSFGFRAGIFYSSSVTADIKFAFSIPAAASILWNGNGVVLGSGVSGDGTFNTANASDAALSYGAAGVGTTLFCSIEGSYIAGGTAGNLQFRAAQNTAELSNTTIVATSRLEVWRIV